MKANVRIKRGGGYAVYETACSGNTTVAKLLDLINMEESDPVEWECSCQQNMCGSCAMLINGRPALACAVFVRDTGENITLEPLTKFPLIKDLKVDRGRIREIASAMKAYPAAGSEADIGGVDRQYLASSCLMCGCCMEVCPNYTGRDLFGGAMAANAMLRTIAQERDKRRRRELSSLYRRNQFNCCTKALSCSEVCPIKLPLASTFSRLNSEMLRAFFGLPKGGG